MGVKIPISSPLFKYFEDLGVQAWIDMAKERPRHSKKGHNELLKFVVDRMLRMTPGKRASPLS